MKPTAFAAFAGAMLMATAACAQQGGDYAAVQIKSTDLGHKTWMLQGAGGNITVIEGDEAVIIVDTEFAPLHDKIKAAVTDLTHKPIRYVVDTHLHGDHTGGNQAFWLDGATLVGQELLRRSMAEGTTNALSGAKTPPAPAAALPGVTYAEHMTLKIKGRRVELTHMPAAHTRGDTAVWIKDADVLAAGDIVSTGGRYPNLDVGDGGGINGMIKSVDGYLKQVDAKTKIVPGHGAVMNREGLKTYRQVLVDARDAVKALKAKGLSEDQAAAAMPLAAVQAKVGATDQASVNFTRLIYKSL